MNIPNYNDRCKQARATNTGDQWQHRKTGKTLRILKRLCRDVVEVQHQSGTVTAKQDHYLAGDYFLLPNT